MRKMWSYEIDNCTCLLIKLMSFHGKSQRFTKNCYWNGNVYFELKIIKKCDFS